MSALTVATGFTNAVALTYSANRNVAVVGERGGRLVLLDLLRPVAGGYEQRVIGDGYRNVDHVAYDDISDRLLIADADGVWVARLATADRADATAFAHAPVDVRALCTASAAGSPVALVLDGDPAPHVDSYNLGAGPGTVVGTLLESLDGAKDAAVADSASVFLLTSAAGGNILQLADWTTSTVTQISSGAIPFGGHVAALDSQWALVVSKSGEFACVRRDGALRRPTAAGSPSAVTAIAVTKEGHVLMATTDSVLEDTLPAGIRERVLLTLDPGPIFIGGYAKVHVDVAGTGLTIDQIELSVREPDLGAISPSRDATFDPDHPHLLLTGGWRPGVGEILAKEIATGTVVGRANFRIDETWRDSRVGPSFCVTGKVDSPVVKPAWGGGDAGIQNVDVYKAPAKWRVAIVMIDSTTNPYPTLAADIAKIRQNWFDNFTGGVPSGGVTRSVTAYYSEVSYGKLTMSLVGNKVAGPVHATGSWDDLFELETVPDPANPGATLPRRWNPKPDTWKTLVSTLEQANAAAVKAGNPALVDFGKTDAVAFVVRTVNAPVAGVNPPTGVSIGRYVAAADHDDGQAQRQGHDAADAGHAGGLDGHRRQAGVRNAGPRTRSYVAASGSLPVPVDEPGAVGARTRGVGPDVQRRRAPPPQPAQPDGARVGRGRRGEGLQLCGQSSTVGAGADHAASSRDQDDSRQCVARCGDSAGSRPQLLLRVSEPAGRVAG